MKKKIIFIIVAVIIIACGLLFKHYRNDYEDTPADNELKEQKNIYSINKEVVIETIPYQQTWFIKTLEETVKDNGYRYKIYVDATNRSDIDTKTLNHKFELYDESDNKISSCYSDMSTSHDVDDILPMDLPGNSTVSGYLYCDSSAAKATKFKITAVIGGIVNASGKVDYTYEYYDVNIE